MVPIRDDSLGAVVDRLWSAPSDDDVALVAAGLGRVPRGRWCVAVRDSGGRPTVIRNEPFLEDGRPMPTEFWLIDRNLNRRIGTLEAEGGVRAAENAVGMETLDRLHARVARRRSGTLGDNGDPAVVPTGGVGGTRRGVKCLHAHYANWLATGDDDVGEWVHRNLVARGWAL